MKLVGQTAITTGGGRDIGAAVARKLAAEGANAAISYFESSKGADVVVAESEGEGGKAIGVQADLNTQAGVDDAANLVLFLACTDSAFITGTNIDINGGMLFS